MSLVAVQAAHTRWMLPTGSPRSAAPEAAPQDSFVPGTVSMREAGGVLFGEDKISRHKLWSHQTQAAVFSSPLLGQDGTLYFGGQDQKVYAIDSKTTALKWTCPVDKEIWGSPRLSADGKMLFIASLDGILHGIEAASGREKWSRNVGWRVESTPAVGKDGTVYVGSAFGRISAIDGKSGAARWQFMIEDPEHSADACPLLSADEKTLYTGSSGGRLYALDTASGAQKWHFDARGGIHGAPVMAPDGISLYVPCENGRLYCVDSRTGEELWQFKTERGIRSSPVLGQDGTIYLGSGDGKIYAIDPSTRELKWSFETGGSIFGSPAVGPNGHVYVGSHDHSVYALDGQTGERRWSFESGKYVNGSPTVGPDGTIYVGSYDGKLYALVEDADSRRLQELQKARQVDEKLVLREEDQYLIVGSVKVKKKR